MDTIGDKPKPINDMTLQIHNIHTHVHVSAMTQLKINDNNNKTLHLVA